MTQYTETPVQWKAVKYDGTNETDISAALEESGGNRALVRVIPSSSYLAVFDLWDGPANAYHALGSIDASYQPWLVYQPMDPNSYEPGPVRIARDDGNGAPLGFTAV